MVSGGIEEKSCDQEPVNERHWLKLRFPSGSNPHDRKLILDLETDIAKMIFKDGAYTDGYDFGELNSDAFLWFYGYFDVFYSFALKEFISAWATTNSKVVNSTFTPKSGVKVCETF